MFVYIYIYDDWAVWRQKTHQKKAKYLKVCAHWVLVSTYLNGNEENNWWMKTLFKIKIYHISGLLWKRGRPLSKWLSVACPLDSSRNSFTTLFVHMLKMSPGNRAKQIFYKIKCYSKFSSNKGLFSSQNFEVAARKIVCEQQAEINDNRLQTRIFCRFISEIRGRYLFLNGSLLFQYPFRLDKYA